MTRLLVLMIVVLFIGGIAMTFVPFFIPEAAQALAPIICPDGGTVEPRQIPSSRGGISISYVCVDERGRESEGSPLGYLLLFTGWCWLPLIPAVLLIFAMIGRSRARAAAQVPNVAEQVVKGAARGQQFNLTDKLQQLEDARSAGKITNDDYHNAKKALLRDL